MATESILPSVLGVVSAGISAGGQVASVVIRADADRYVAKQNQKIALLTQQAAQAAADQAAADNARAQALLDPGLLGASPAGSSSLLLLAVAAGLAAALGS